MQDVGSMSRADLIEYIRLQDRIIGSLSAKLAVAIRPKIGRPAKCRCDSVAHREQGRPKKLSAIPTNLAAAP